MNRVLARVTLGVAAVAALSFTGCLKANDDVTVKADGSGAFTEKLSIDLTAMKGIAEQMGKGFGAPGEAAMGEKKPEKDTTLDDLKKEWKDIEGLEITNATSEEKDGKVNVVVEATFKTLEAYAKASKVEMNASLKKNEDGSYTLRFGDDPPPAGEAAKGEDPMAAAMLGMFEPFMKDMEMTRKLTLPGKIVETNGTKGEDGSTVSWKVTFADLKTGKSPEQTVTFKGDGIDIKPFGVKREHKGMGGDMPK